MGKNDARVAHDPNGLDNFKSLGLDIFINGNLRRNTIILKWDAILKDDKHSAKIIIDFENPEKTSKKMRVMLYRYGKYDYKKMWKMMKKEFSALEDKFEDDTGAFMGYFRGVDYERSERQHLHVDPFKNNIFMVRFEDKDMWEYMGSPDQTDWIKKDLLSGSAPGSEHWKVTNARVWLDDKEVKVTNIAAVSIDKEHHKCPIAKYPHSDGGQKCMFWMTDEYCSWFPRYLDKKTGKIKEMDPDRCACINSPVWRMGRLNPTCGGDPMGMCVSGKTSQDYVADVMKGKTCAVEVNICNVLSNNQYGTDADSNLYGNYIDVNCGTKPSDTATCDTRRGECVPDSRSSITMSECKKSCKKSYFYSCDKETGSCKQDDDGTQSLSECKKTCKEDDKYSCNYLNGQCVKDKSGTYLPLCQKSCKVLYKCNGEICVPSKDGVPFENCRSQCPPKFSCKKSGKFMDCVRDDSSKLTYTECKSSCSNKYSCKDGKCNIDNDKGKMSQSECSSTCVDKYSCKDGKCFKDSDGKWTESECKDNCKVDIVEPSGSEEKVNNNYILYIIIFIIVIVAVIYFMRSGKSKPQRKKNI